MATRIRETRLQEAQDTPSAFTLAAVALRAGVAMSTLQTWESGESRPRQRNARRLAKALGVSLDDLGLDTSPSMVPSEPEGAGT